MRNDAKETAATYQAAAALRDVNRVIGRELAKMLLQPLISLPTAM